MAVVANKLQIMLNHIKVGIVFTVDDHISIRLDTSAKM